MNIRTLLRQQVADCEQRLSTLVHMGSASIHGLSAVPPEVHRIWDDMSHCCKLILSGCLSRVDLEALFPNELGPASLPSLFSMPRPSYGEKQMQFVTFFNDVKKSSDPRPFFGFEGRIREFLTTAILPANSRRTDKHRRLRFCFH
jgi:hypothetical protein